MNKLLLQLYISFIRMKAESRYTTKQLFTNMKPFLETSSPFKDKPIQEGWYDTVMDYLTNDFQILVVGAGGLGCEIVKNLALSGIRKIHLIDMDTIDLTNLNRQFLFRMKDINKKKAEVVAQFVMRRCPGVEVIPYTCKVQQKQYSFYTQFSIIVGGLDNVQARKFLNTMAHQINQDEEETVCFYIDGATQGFEGQCLVTQPFKTSCYNCSLPENLVTGMKANYCTIANTPRTPQHCVQYVLEIEWDKQFPNTKRDNDNIDHMTWAFQKSLERAKQFKIEGVTEMLTLGLAKNIIPAIASTNALIAAFCANEALKIVTGINPNLKNYFYYRGGTSTGSDSYQMGKKPNCTACDMRINKLKPLELTVLDTSTFGELLKSLNKANSVISVAPFVNINQKTFFNPGDKARSAVKEKKTIRELQNEKIFTYNPQQIVVTDSSLKAEQRVIVTIEKDLAEVIDQQVQNKKQ